MSKAALGKIAAFWAVFVLFHYAYELFQQPALTLISQTRETFLQHAKIGLFAFALVSGVELALRRRAVQQPDHARPHFNALVWSRVIALLLLPWVMFILYYTGPAFYGRSMPSIPAEIVYANIVLLAVAATLVTLEHSMQRAELTRPTRVLILVLLLLAAAEMIVFTYRLPWAPFF